MSTGGIPPHVPLVNFLSFLSSPESKTSVSFSILSCSSNHACNWAREGNSGTSVADARTASSPANTSIGGSCSRNWSYLVNDAPNLLQNSCAP